MTRPASRRHPDVGLRCHPAMSPKRSRPQSGARATVRRPGMTAEYVARAAPRPDDPSQYEIGCHETCGIDADHEVGPAVAVEVALHIAAHEACSPATP